VIKNQQEQINFFNNIITMSTEMMIMLQQVLNSLDYPSFVSNGDEVILTNEIFKANKMEKSCCDAYWKKNNLILQKTSINDGLYLCQLIPDEIKMLKKCTKKLAQAVNLL